jgi:hypothetical protein
METQQSDLNTDATNVRGSETPQTLPLASQKTCFWTKQNQHQYLFVLSHFLVTVHCYQEQCKATPMKITSCCIFPSHPWQVRKKRGLTTMTYITELDSKISYSFLLSAYAKSRKGVSGSKCSGWWWWGHQATCISKQVISSVISKGSNTFQPFKRVF